MGKTLPFPNLASCFREPAVRIVLVRLVIEGRCQKGSKHRVRCGSQGLEDPDRYRNVLLGQIVDQPVQRLSSAHA